MFGMLMRTINIFGDFLTRSEREVFVGFFEGKLRFEDCSLFLSRTHSQPNRIYSANGVHPTLSASETLGRYWIVYADESY